MGDALKARLPLWEKGPVCRRVAFCTTIRNSDLKIGL